MNPVFWMVIVTNVAIIGIAAAAVIPVSRALARRLSAPRADADRVDALEAELESTQLRLGQTEERLAFMERMLETGKMSSVVASVNPNAEDSRI